MNAYLASLYNARARARTRQAHRRILVTFFSRLADVGRSPGQANAQYFALFNLVSLAGLVITTGTLRLLVRHLGFYYLAANLLGIALATAWNFVANSLWTWGGAR